MDTYASGDLGYHGFGGRWTEIKLEAVEKYLSAFNYALSKQSFTRLYIDAFAGTGRCDITVDGVTSTIEGSATRALMSAPPFHKYVLIERDDTKLEALRELKSQFPTKEIDVVPGDANKALTNLVAKLSWKNHRAVLFLDPYGLAVEWKTLEAIAATKAIDVWYLFPFSGLYRQAPKDAAALDASKEEAISRLLGTEEWRNRFYSPKRQQDLFHVGDAPLEREINVQDMLSYVSERLKTIFPAVAQPKILYQSGDPLRPRGAPLFALYFAASNPSPKAQGIAMRVADHILKS